MVIIRFDLPKLQSLHNVCKLSNSVVPPSENANI